MARSFGFLGTYPPTQCGIATFSASLLASLAATCEVGIVRIVDQATADARVEVTHEMVRGAGGARAAAAALDRFDVAIVQHEFGIYGGADGDEAIEVLHHLTSPAVVVLHTVLAEPTPHQRVVLQQVVDHASAIVVMTRSAQRRLLAEYRVDPTQVSVIPHGAPTEWAEAGAACEAPEATMLTWGLLGPGKGIEWAIDALSMLSDLDPLPSYLVLGETHPRIVERHGDAYREGLERQAATLGVADRVRFDRRYLDRASLRRRIMAAQVIVLPYDSKDQVTSGVLIEAVACRRPAVATAFPHAVELLSGGAGIVVAQRDPAAIAAAVWRIVGDPALAAGMVEAAQRLAPHLSWRAVGERYQEVAARADVDAASIGA